MTHSNDGTQFNRLPRTSAHRQISERPTREEVVAFFADRYGVSPDIFEEYTFWEKGTGNIWAFAGDVPSPIEVEALGIHILRTNQHHWKPTTDAMQRFGQHVEHQVIALTCEEARQFWRGEPQAIDWDGPSGYVLVTHPIAGRHEPLGIGLYGSGELRSQIPKGRRRDLPVP